MQYIEEDILLINDAITYLKEGEVLLSIDNNSSLFKYKNNKVLIVNKDNLNNFTF